MTNYNIADYTFLGLFDNGRESPIIKSIAYLISLVEEKQCSFLDLEKQKLMLRGLFDVEEQVTTAAELLDIQKKVVPPGVFPQTPVMVTSEWSPIAAMLERRWMPITLIRESRPMACASGVWDLTSIDAPENYEQCNTQQELFWFTMGKVIQKAKNRRLLINVAAKPGWSYESNIDRPRNLSFAEAERADRVVWRRTPR